MLSSHGWCVPDYWLYQIFDPIDELSSRRSLCFSVHPSPFLFQPWCAQIMDRKAASAKLLLMPILALLTTRTTIVKSSWGHVEAPSWSYKVARQVVAQANTHKQRVWRAQAQMCTWGYGSHQSFLSCSTADQLVSSLLTSSSSSLSNHSKLCIA